MANMMTELQSACSARKPIRTGSGLPSGALCHFRIWVDSDLSLSFPADWEMSELSELSSIRKRGCPTKPKVEKQEF